METYIIMLLLIMCLGLLLAWKMKLFANENEKFFNFENTRALRAFFCIVIFLVHVPPQYQNPLQDMVGSFAYIGVTFFFMTSGYGLQRAVVKNANYLGTFWCNRLPKLLIPNLLCNILFSILFSFLHIDESVFVFNINAWVKWLLICYFLFWVCNKFIKAEKTKTSILCVSLIILSFVTYLLKSTGYITTTTWTTEVVGFIYGILLVKIFTGFKVQVSKRWWRNVLGLVLSSGTLGILYLNYKSSLFWGDYLLKIALGLSIICLIILLNSRISVGNKINQAIGDISFEIYLSHVYCMRIVSTLMPDLPSGRFICVSMLVTLVVACGIHILSKYVFVYINKLLSKITYSH